MTSNRVLLFMLIKTDQSNLNFLGLNVIACFACIVYFSINMTKMCVTRHTCMMHIIKPIAGNEPKSFQLLIVLFVQDHLDLCQTPRSFFISSSITVITCTFLPMDSVDRLHIKKYNSVKRP
jgi:hypothetical protein